MTIKLQSCFFVLIAAFCFSPCFIDCDISAKDFGNQQDNDLTGTPEEIYPNVTQISGGYHDVFTLMDQQLVSIASKTEEEVSKAPSIITVITAKEIENMGARTLTDALRIIPGFDIVKGKSFGTVRYSARGMQNSGSNSKIKALVNNHPLNMPLFGATALFFDDFPLKHVKKIEVIRGPGSALYGSNAFLAVINIITKNAEDIDGIEIAGGFGSFDTQDYSVLYGKKVYGVDISGFANFYNTNGLSEAIEQDKLSGTPFSITPGDTDDGRNKIDLNLKLAYKDLELNGKYINKDTESFVGSGVALTNDNENFLNYVMANLSYKIERDRLSINPRIYYDQFDFKFDIQGTPEGFTLLDDPDGDGDFERFPEGIKSVGLGTNRRLGSEIQIDYELFSNNTFTMGFAYEWETMDNSESFNNRDPITGASLGSLQDTTDTANWIREKTRQIWAVYMQDKWDIVEDMGLTIGIRHDHYSDFEGTTNPRIGFVWDFMENATLKLLYGQAFRAPHFRELYSVNNTVSIGNPDLKPETIRTYEVGLAYKFTDELNVNVNYFFNVIRDEIVLGPKSSSDEPRVYGNLGGANIQGIEFEAKAALGNFWDDAYFYANYTYQDAEAKGDPLPDAPKHKGNVGVNFGLTKYLNANLHTFINGPRPREESDTRDDSPGYAVANMTLIAKNFFKDMKIKASLFNLLDKNYYDPAPSSIPNDLPRPGRTFYVELGYEF